jgi:hypothetical protein
MCLITASVSSLHLCRFCIDFRRLNVLANDNASRIFACLMMDRGTAEVCRTGSEMLAWATEAVAMSMLSLTAMISYRRHAPL